MTLGMVASLPTGHAAPVTVELSSADGATVCPSMLSGKGQALWSPTTSTCSLTSTAPVSPTLCISGNVSGCVVKQIDILRIDFGTTFLINTTEGGVTVYSRLDNYGVIYANDVGLSIYGIMNNYGLVNITSKANLETLPGLHQGLINNRGTIFNTGVIDNQAALNNTGTVGIFCYGVFEGNQVLGNPIINHTCIPLAPTITTPSGTVFSTSTPTITGVSLQNVTITLFDGSIVVGTTVSDFTGNWTIKTSTLAVGYHNLTATATNYQGSSPHSPSIIIRVIPTPPILALGSFYAGIPYAGGSTIIVNNFTNIGGAIDRVTGLYLNGGALGNWTLQGVPFDLAAGQSRIVNMTITIPRTAYAGNHTITVTTTWEFYSPQNGTWFYGPTLSFSGSLPVQPASTPPPNNSPPPTTTPQVSQTKRNSTSVTGPFAFMASQAGEIIVTGIAVLVAVCFVTVILATRPTAGSLMKPRLALYCTQCGRLNAEGNRFCFNCGNQMGAYRQQ